jgi:putative transposase
MSHSLTKIWIHAVYGTKNFEPLVRHEFEASLQEHIKHHLEQDFACPVRAINGTADHMHTLFLLDPNYALKDILKNLKGESSHWANQQNFMNQKFAWQTGSGAFSVSESAVKDVKRYIENQKEHHRKRTYIDEYLELARANGLQVLAETVETVCLPDHGHEPTSEDVG